MIIGVDPSFKSTGVAVYSDNMELLKSFRIQKPNTCYKILESHEACDSIVEGIESQIVESTSLIIEYPVFQSLSGARLAILHGYLAKGLLLSPLVREIVWVGPSHCDSYTKNKSHSKTYLVDYCKKKGWITKRTSHDECTAIILAHLYKDIKASKWEHSFFIEKGLNGRSVKASQVE